MRGPSRGQAPPADGLIRPAGCPSVGCAALTPIGFGKSLTPAGPEPAAVFRLLFGVGCRLFAGLLDLVNRDLCGGTLYLTFAFRRVVNAWALHALSKSLVPDAGIVFATEAAFLAVFVLMTWGFGQLPSLLFVFLLDIALFYAAKVAAHLPDTKAFVLPVALLTVGLAVLSLWIAFALLLDSATGRRVFPMGASVFQSLARPPLELSAGTAFVAALDGRWRDEGAPLPRPSSSLGWPSSARRG